MACLPNNRYGSNSSSSSSRCEFSSSSTLFAFAAAKAKFGRIDVVANNAGYAALGEVEAMAEADARGLFETNFWGSARVAREAVRFFREVNPPGVGGRLLQFSSQSGIQGMGGFGYYCASKFGESRNDI